MKDGRQPNYLQAATDVAIESLEQNQICQIHIYVSLMEKLIDVFEDK